MAKLYWRIKRNGKWTWVAATPENSVFYEDWNAFYTGSEKLGSEYPVTAKEIGLRDEEE